MFSCAKLIQTILVSCGFGVLRLIVALLKSHCKSKWGFGGGTTSVLVCLFPVVSDCAWPLRVDICRWIAPLTGQYAKISLVAAHPGPSSSGLCEMSAFSLDRFEYEQFCARLASTHASV